MKFRFLCPLIVVFLTSCDRASHITGNYYIQTIENGADGVFYIDEKINILVGQMGIDDYQYNENFIVTMDHGYLKGTFHYGDWYCVIPVCCDDSVKNVAPIVEKYYGPYDHYQLDSACVELDCIQLAKAFGN